MKLTPETLVALGFKHEGDDYFMGVPHVGPALLKGPDGDDCYLVTVEDRRQGWADTVADLLSCLFFAGYRAAMDEAPNKGEGK